MTSKRDGDARTASTSRWRASAFASATDAEGSSCLPGTDPMARKDLIEGESAGDARRRDVRTNDDLEVLLHITIEPHPVPAEHVQERSGCPSLEASTSSYG
ncbi:hypothetical protein [Planctomycetes bacterium Poly30]